MQIYTKSSLIQKLKRIKAMGWIKTQRPGNAGAVGNTLEDLLGIKENNLPIPNAAEWELKAQRKNTTSLTTLFHMEPSPQGANIVSSILLPHYGWAHKEAGTKHKAEEKRFSLTTNAVTSTDRGFKVVVDREEKKVEISFDPGDTNLEKHKNWLAEVEKNIGLGQISPQPYWGFKDLMYKAGTKLKNSFYVLADNKWEGFDARSGHNHGTKFRIRQNHWPDLYKSCIRVF